MDNTAVTDDPLASLVTLAVEGDRRALGTLCKQLQGPIYRLALRMLGNSADAEDATQEILVQVVTHLAQFKGESRLLTWVYTIASRHLLRRARTDRERQYEAGPIADMIDLGLSATMPNAQPEGEVRVLEREVRLACTQSMLFVLTREERIAVLLVEVVGVSDGEAASICDVTVDALRQRLARGRAKLRPVLEERCGIANSDLPCNCRRQAAARQQIGPIPLRWTKLPVESDVHQAQLQIQALRQTARVFGTDGLIAPPETVWSELVQRFPALFG